MEAENRKRERFVRIAERRVDKALEDLESLGEVRQQAQLSLQ